MQMFKIEDLALFSDGLLLFKMNSKCLSEQETDKMYCKWKSKNETDFLMFEMSGF